MNKYTFNVFFKLLSRKKILCIGDIILDNFIDNEIVKLSDEDPIHVINEKSSNYKLGGVGNVALNLANAGAKIKLVTVGSSDKNSKILNRLLLDKKIDNKIFLNKNKITTLKKRLYIQNYHLIRIDNENVLNISDNLSNKILNYINKIIKNQRYDAMLVSDYEKGFITDYFFEKLSKLSKKFKIKIFTDPKSRNFNKYNGSFLFKANRKEINTYLSKFDLNIDSIDYNKNKERSKIKNALKKLKIKNFIITRSEKSTILFENNNLSKLSFIPVDRQDIVNTTGAGDTFFSYFTLNYIINNNFHEAIKFAHLFSRFSINKFGTYAPTFSEIFLNILKIKQNNFTQDKTILKKIINDLKSKKISIGFTNGCFDILHAGHINLLKKAKSMCDFLIVALNNDESIKKNKGNKRPYNNIETRSLIMSSLSFVDFICVFNQKTPINLIKFVNPNFLFKGSDYKEKDVVGYNFLKQNKGKVLIIKNYKYYSSTKIIEKLS